MSGLKPAWISLIVMSPNDRTRTSKLNLYSELKDDKALTSFQSLRDSIETNTGRWKFHSTYFDPFATLFGHHSLKTPNNLQQKST